MLPVNFPFEYQFEIVTPFVLWKQNKQKNWMHKTGLFASEFEVQDGHFELLYTIKPF